MSKRVTINEIAEKARVSIGSVHCALAGKPGVSEDTRLRILAIATELNYRPNTAAAALKRKAVRIAAVLPGPKDDNRFFYTQVWEGIRDYFRAAADFNIELIEAPYYTDIDDPSEELNRLGEHKLDGLLTVGYLGRSGVSALRNICRQGSRIVLIGGDVPQINRLCCVQPNYSIIGMTIAELLIRQAPEGGNILACIGDIINPAHSEIVLGMDAYIEDHKLSSKLIKIQTMQTSQDIYKHILYTLRNSSGVAACCSINARGSVLLARALKETGLAGTLPALGSDLFEENIQALKDGVFTNLLHKSPYLQSYLAARYLVDYLIREVRPPQDTVYVGSEIVFQSSLPMYNNGSYRFML